MTETSRYELGPVAPTAEAPYHDLWTKPFRENTDPNVLWLGPQFRDAFAALRSAILQNAGLLILTGDVGSGKTILARALADSLRAEGVRVGRLAYVGPQPGEFWNAVAEALKLPGVDDDHAGVPSYLGEVLHEAYGRCERILLVIDEAQDLVPAVLDEIDSLARVGLEAGRGKVNVINILLVGQPEVEAVVARRRPLDGQPPVAVRLRPLPAEQVTEYVAFRLRVAGADRELFSGDAVEHIGAAAAGVPRLINRICDCALQTAARRGQSVVGTDIVAETLRDFGLIPAASGRGARHGIRRFAYAAALVLAVGLGVVIYQGWGGSGGHGADRRDAAQAAVAVHGIPVTEPAAGLAPLAESPGPPVLVEEIRPPAGAPTPDTPGEAPAPAAVTPRRDAPRVPRAAARAERLDHERVSGAPAASATRVRTPTAAVDRAPGASAPAPERRVEGAGAGESHDPAAIINWLLQGNRPAAER